MGFRERGQANMPSQAPDLVYTNTQIVGCPFEVTNSPLTQSSALEQFSALAVGNVIELAFSGGQMCLVSAIIITFLTYAQPPRSKGHLAGSSLAASSVQTTTTEEPTGGFRLARR